MENFKLQSLKIKIEKLHEPRDKSEINGFYTGKNSKFNGSFPEVVLWDIGISGFFDVAFDSHISSIVRFVVDRVIKLVSFVSVAEGDNSPASNLRPSPLLPPPLVLGNSLPNSCVTDVYCFSSIITFAMFTKSINDCTVLFGAFSLFMIQD